MSSTGDLYQRYYFSRANYMSGTTLLQGFVRRYIPEGSSILEIGAGPTNPISDFLAGFGPVIGLDVDQEVSTNSALKAHHTFSGSVFPFSANSFAACFSNYVLEHVVDVHTHFSEVARVLKPGGHYVFRTPNRWHYVTIASRLLPHSFHLRMANRVRALPDSAHDPYTTVYRANDRRTIARLARANNLSIERLTMIECEPSYGAAHPLLFYPMMAYERLVNSTDLLSGLRVNIVGTLQKH